MGDGEGMEMRGERRDEEGWVYRFAGVGTPAAEPLAQLVPFPVSVRVHSPGLWAQHSSFIRTCWWIPPQPHLTVHSNPARPDFVVMDAHKALVWRGNNFGVVTTHTTPTLSSSWLHTSCPFTHPA